MTVTGAHAPPSAARRPARPAHRDANVLRWLASYAASMIGDGVYFLALGWAARHVAGPAQVGAVMAVGAVPRAVLMLGGGVVADRFGPRRTVIGSDAVRCAVILGTAAVLALGEPGLWPLLLVALVFGVVDALFMPAIGALPPRITGRDQLVRVHGMRALVIRIGNTAGPPLGGLAMGLGGVAAAFACAGGLFAVSLVLLVTVRIGPLPTAGTDPDTRASTESGTTVRERDTTAWRDLTDGLRYVRRHPLVGPLVLSGAISEFALVGALNVGMVLLADARGWGAVGMGLLISAFGVGAGGGALLLTVLGRLPRAGAVQIVTLLVGSAGIGGIGLMPGLPAALAVAGCGGLAAGVCGGLAQALVQTAADPAYLGRITAVMSLSSFGLAPLSYPLFGAAVALWGVGHVYAACGALGMLAAVVTLLAPAARTAELPGKACSQ